MEINIKYDEKLKKEIKKVISISLIPLLFLVMFFASASITGERAINWTNNDFYTSILSSVWFIGAVILFFVSYNSKDLEEIKEILKEKPKEE